MERKVLGWNHIKPSPQIFAIEESKISNKDLSAGFGLFLYSEDYSLSPPECASMLIIPAAQCSL